MRSVTLSGIARPSRPRFRPAGGQRTRRLRPGAPAPPQDRRPSRDSALPHGHQDGRATPGDPNASTAERAPSSVATSAISPTTRMRLHVDGRDLGRPRLGPATMPTTTSISPWEHGRFSGGFGPRHVWRLAGGAPAASGSTAGIGMLLPLIFLTVDGWLWDSDQHRHLRRPRPSRLVSRIQHPPRHLCSRAVSRRLSQLHPIGQTKATAHAAVPLFFSSHEQARGAC